MSSTSGARLCMEGQLSLIFFTGMTVLAVVPEIGLRLGLEQYAHQIVEWVTNIKPDNQAPQVWLIHLVQFVTLNIAIRLLLSGFPYQIAVRSTLLGYSFGLGLTIAIVGEYTWQAFGVYMSVLAFFHYSEFLAIAWTNPEALTVDTFVLQHSWAYSIAACSSWVEFLVECYYYPEFKDFSCVSLVGLFFCIGGETFRKLAILTARRNFNHIVQSKKAEDHQLVTHGVYSLCRHPSYAGWFYWSIGTQLILKNPICLFGYAVASWKFFNDRILIEEITLLNFFKDAYVEYQKKVPTGLPWITGYKINT